MRRFDDHLLLSPSDLNDLLECRHLMALEIARFRGEPVPERTRGAHTEILVRYGEEHEARVLAELEAEGVPVVRIETGAGQGRLREAVEQTRAAMVDGARVIHQAALVAGGVGGYADFLERVDRPSRLGEWSYEVADAKLARTTKPYFLVQLSAYAAMLEELQGLAPEDVIVLLGDGSRDTYRTADFAAYVRALHDRADKLVNAGVGDTYPLPCSHCAICGYRHACEQRRVEDDHLSLVAGLGRDQAVKLEEAGVSTLAGLAELPESTKIPRLARNGWPSSGPRRRCSLRSASPGSSATSCSPDAAGAGSRGSRRRPPATCSSTSRAIHTGATRGSSTCSACRPTEAATSRSGRTTAAQERAAFEHWVDWVTARLARAPGPAHLPLQPLRADRAEDADGTYGTREAEVDELLRRKVFVRPLRGRPPGVRHRQPRATRSRRSRRLYPFERDAEVTEAGGSILAYEEYLERATARWRRSRSTTPRTARSTLGLRDWLRELREELIGTGVEVEWRLDPEEPEEQRERMDEETRELRAVAGPRIRRTSCSAASALPPPRGQADLVVFERLKMTDEELRDEDGEAIGGLESDWNGVAGRPRLAPGADEVPGASSPEHRRR